MPCITCYTDFCPMIKMAVALLQGPSRMSISEKVKIGNVMLEYPSGDFYSILWWGRFRFSVSQMKVLCLLSVHKKRSNTVVSLASNFTGENF